MRLIILFDKGQKTLERLKIEKSDHVVLQGEIDLPCECFDINKTNIDYSAYKGSWDKAFMQKQKAGELDSYILELITSAAPNIFLHNFRFLALWIETVKLLINKNKYSEIVFSSLIKSNYFPYYEAEGEINKGLFYKSGDFIPSCLVEYLNVNFSEINISILNKHSRLALFFRIFTRRYVLFFFKFLLHFKNVLTSNRNSKINTNELKILILSRGIAHTNYIKYFFINNKNVFVHSSDGMFSDSSNTKYLKSIDNSRVLSMYDNLTVLDLLRSFFNIVFNLLFFKKVKTVNINGININFNSIIREILIAQLEVDLHVMSVFNTVRDNKKQITVITCEMLTQYPYWLKIKLDSVANLKFFQLQTTSLDLFEYPDFIHSDGFLFKSQRDLDFFSGVYQKKICQLKFWGNLSFIRSTITNRENNDLRNVIYLSQPYEYENQLTIISYLIELSNEYGFELFIKPHPRDDVQKFEGDISSICSKVKFLAKELDVVEFKKIADLMILRTSSISQDLYLNFIPTLNILLTDFDRNVKVEYLSSNQFNVIKELSELEGVIVNYSSFGEKFERFCLEYSLKVGVTKDLEDFTKKINN